MSILKQMGNGKEFGAKEVRVLEAAKTVFLRYGFRRVTMHDVAEAAGISRPALYLIYCNKEEVFKATVRLMSERIFAEIRNGLPAQPTVEAQLLFTFELWTVSTFEMLLASPDAKDLIDCVHEFARETMDLVDIHFEALLVEILNPLTTPVAPPILPAAQIAHLLAASAHGFKAHASSVAEVRSMIAGLITLTLAALRT